MCAFRYLAGGISELSLRGCSVQLEWENVELPVVVESAIFFHRIVEIFEFHLRKNTICVLVLVSVLSEVHGGLRKVFF